MNGLTESSGVWGALKRVIDTLLSTAQNRVELFAVELQEEKCRLAEAIVLAGAVAAFGMMTLSMVTLTVVILFWDTTGRNAALIVLSVIYLVATALTWRALQARLKARTSFGSTIDEIKKDRGCLEAPRT